MRLHEFIKDADDQEVTELIGKVARGIGGAVKGAAKLGYNATAAAASAMGAGDVADAMKGKGAVANALAKTEKDPAQKAAERKELADKIQELEAQVRELRKAQTEV
jgi:hypothetical protein